MLLFKTLTNEQQNFILLAAIADISNCEKFFGTKVNDLAEFKKKVPEIFDYLKYAYAPNSDLSSRTLKDMGEEICQIIVSEELA